MALRGVSIALACRTFEVSETCYRYSAKLNDENEQIADLLIGLTRAKKTWGFGLCFLYLRNVRGHRWNHTACAMISAGKRWRLYRADASSVMPIDYCLDPHQPVKATPPS